MLAGLPGVQLIGHQRDRLGRNWIAVAVTQGTGAGRSRQELLFDPATSNLLQTEDVSLGPAAFPLPGGRYTRPEPAGTVTDYTDFISRGVVNSITRLPASGRLPLRPAGGGQR